MRPRVTRRTVRLAGDVRKLVVIRRAGRIRMVIHDQGDGGVPLIQATLTPTDAARLARALCR